MARKRKVHGAEFKARVALEAASGGMTLHEVARKYEVHPNQVTAWKKQLLAGMPELFSRKRGRRAEEAAETEGELYRKIGQLQVEVDWLKKKLEL